MHALVIAAGFLFDSSCPGILLLGLGMCCVCYFDAIFAVYSISQEICTLCFVVCFAVLCCGYTLTDFPISIRLTSLALWQSNDCPSASKATLMNMDKYFMWIHYERLHNHNQAKHNKTVCIFLGIYCINECQRLNYSCMKQHCVLVHMLLYTVYPKKYAYGFCFAVLCCGYTLTDFPISIRLTSLALWQSNDCPSASKATLMNMDKYFMWIHYERLHNHNQAKHNKTVYILLY